MTRWEHEELKYYSQIDRGRGVFADVIENARARRDGLMRYARRHLRDHLEAQGRESRRQARRLNRAGKKMAQIRNGSPL